MHNVPPSHNGIAPALRAGPFGQPGSIPGGGVHFSKASKTLESGERTYT